MEIRQLQLVDAEKLLVFFEKLVKADPERVERMEDVKNLDVEKEKEWIQKRLLGEQKQEFFAMVVEADGEIVAEGEVERLKRWPERHVAEIRFGVLPSHEEAASGMIEKLESIAQKFHIEILLFFHFVTAERVIEIMEKAGFLEVGRVEGYYKRDGNYIDRIYMTKRISK